jgi:hypothetical protein
MMIHIGPSRFRGISSDSTGNTSSGRTLTKNDFPWIIILPDSCHRMDKLCKDISKIKYFQPVSLSPHIRDSELRGDKAYRGPISNNWPNTATNLNLLDLSQL